MQISHRVRYTRTESALVPVAVAAPPLNESVQKNDSSRRRLTISHITDAAFGIHQPILYSERASKDRKLGLGMTLEERRT